MQAKTSGRRLIGSLAAQFPTSGVTLNQIVWLASYPKSGNTWVRLLIGGLSLGQGEPFDLNTTLQRDGNANMRAILDHLSLIETGLLAHDEVDELRPDAYADMARNPAAMDGLRDQADQRFSIRFVKTHDAYGLNRSGRPLLGGAQAASAALVIVRDPRDIAPSLASHLGESIDAAVQRMSEDGKSSTSIRTPDLTA
jgi:aryl sulfotransferase